MLEERDKFLVRLYNIKLPLFLGIIVFVLTSFIVFGASYQSDILITPLTALSYISLLLFIIVCCFGVYANSLYFTFLIFVLLAFPAPVNDFFPGTRLGAFGESGNAVFPFFTHIDIYLVIGLIKAIVNNNRVSFRGSFLFVVVIFCLFISIVTNFFDFKNNQEELLLVQGLFQFRYLIELYLLLSFYDINKYKNNILIGFVISILFLFVESLAYSYKTKSDVLLSGSLANNVFASIVAAITLFLIFVKKRYSLSLLFKTNINVGIIVAIIMVIATGARMAVLSFFVTYFLVSFIESNKNRSFLKKTYWAISLILFVYIVSIAAAHLPKRYNPQTIIDRISINKPSTNLTEFISIKPSWETNSLRTRLELYTTSINMFSKNPVCGIGVGRWNIQKNWYGFKEFLLIDSHNGYLSIISQYGLLGLPFLFFIYFYPTFKIYQNSSKRVDYSFIFYLGLINLYISFSDLSNSGIFKHQIFALLAFNSICFLQIDRFIEPNKSEQLQSSANTSL